MDKLVQVKQPLCNRFFTLYFFILFLKLEKNKQKQSISSLSLFPRWTGLLLKLVTISPYLDILQRICILLISCFEADSLWLEEELQ